MFQVPLLVVRNVLKSEEPGAWEALRPLIFPLPRELPPPWEVSGTFTFQGSWTNLSSFSTEKPCLDLPK